MSPRLVKCIFGPVFIKWVLRLLLNFLICHIGLLRRCQLISARANRAQDATDSLRRQRWQGANLWASCHHSSSPANSPCAPWWLRIHERRACRARPTASSGPAEQTLALWTVIGRWCSHKTGGHERVTAHAVDGSCVASATVLGRFNRSIFVGW